MASFSILQQYVTSKHLKEAKMKGFEGHLTPPVSNSMLGHLSPNLFAVINININIISTNGNKVG